MRARIDVARQRVGISRFQLRDLPPIENARGEFVALFRQVFEHARRRRPRTGLRLAAARQLHLAEQDVAELLWRTKIERLAREHVDVGFEPRHVLREFAGKARENGAVDGDAAPLHARQRFDHRALERFIDMRHPLGGKPRLQHAPEPQRHVRVFGRIFRRLLDRHAGEADEGAAGARDFADLDRLVLQIFGGEFVEAVAVAPGIENVGHQHRVVDGRETQPALGEHDAIDLGVVHDLQHARRREQRRQPVQHIALFQLPGNEIAAEKIAGAFAAMRKRHIPGIAGRRARAKAR